MKAVIAVIFVIVSYLPSSVNAQVRIGLHYGANISRLTEPRQWEWQSRYQGGLVCDIQISKPLFLVVQLNYVEKWAGLDHSPWGQDASGVYHVTLQHSYLELPIYLRWRLTNSTVRWFVEGGPSIAYMISEKLDWWVRSGSAVRTWSEDMRDEFRSVDIALAIGTGVELGVTESLSIAGTFHYSYGLVRVFKDKDQGRATTLGLQPGVALLYAL
jgi:hypothetical protein